jgi:hypothetical protein
MKLKVEDRFQNADDLQAHYAALKLRLYGPKPAVRVSLKPPPLPPLPPEPPVATMKVPPVQEILDMLAPKIMTKTDIPIEHVRIVWEEVVDLVCAHTGYTPRTIFARRREQHLCDARQLLWTLAKIHCLHLSLPSIGRLSHAGDGNGRDHTTVLHGTRKGIHHPKFEMLNEMLNELLAEKQRLAEDAAAKVNDAEAYAGA